VSAQKCGWDVTSIPRRGRQACRHRATSRSRAAPRASHGHGHAQRGPLRPEPAGQVHPGHRDGGRRTAERRAVLRHKPFTQEPDWAVTSINLDLAGAAYEKLPGIGAHPRGIHQWWARRPLTAARAVLFAQLVNDPGYERQLGRGINKERASLERERLFSLIEKLSDWNRSDDQEMLHDAREAIEKSWRETCALNKSHPEAATLFNPDQLPALHDPFAGGGAIPLEAQRLGLQAFASDLNPIPVLINKAMIDIPARFAGQSPVGPSSLQSQQPRLHEDWSRSRGLAEDMRRYGAWIQSEAAKRLGHLYPNVTITPQLAADRPDLARYVGRDLTVISWIWARTVRSPNPAFSDTHVPLISSYVLSTKEGRQTWLEPSISGTDVAFHVRVGTPPEEASNGTKASGRGGFYCLLSGSPIDGKYLKAQGQAGKLETRLLAIVAAGDRERVYLPASPEQERIAKSAIPDWRPDLEFAKNSRHMTPWTYGISRFSDLFTDRQLMALSTFADLLRTAAQRIREDAVKAGLADDDVPLDRGGVGARAYGEAVTVLLSFGLSRLADFNNALCRWNPSNQKIMNLFGRQAIPMAWDFGEANVLAEVVGGWPSLYGWQASCVETLPGGKIGVAVQCDASTQTISQGKVISTDPPYYDNVPYADLADFFYVWLRRAIRPIFPDLFATLAVPKAEELVADNFRHSSKVAAEHFFLDGMTLALQKLAGSAHPAFPVTIYYAFKQSETGEEGTASTGWETFLEAVLRAGFAISGTWPLRSEQTTRMRGMSSNALASSIVLVCRRRADDARQVSRREFIRELNATLPIALDEMTRGGVNSPVVPVDLSQSIIGPGMAIFSQYAAVLEADGTSMSVHTALQLINRFLSEDDFDADSQFCLHWFETIGWGVGKYGDADVLARAKGTSVGGLTEAGVLESSGGQVRLFRWPEYPSDWSPESDQRAAIWEMLHHLIRALNSDGEAAAGALLARMMSKADPIRSLAYRLYTLCERKGWAEEARSYNELVTSWQGIEAAATEAGPTGTQITMDI
jgi:putative DNA methylase